MTQYPRHTDHTVSYMQRYLCVFYETKYVFLPFHAGKKVKRAAAEPHKSLLQEQTEVQSSAQHLTESEKAKVFLGNTLEWRELVDEILRELAHYNFPKIPLILHYAEQIPKSSALEQFSTDISETMYKVFKDTYRQSKRVDSMSQVVTTYTRDHTFAMKDLTIKMWNCVREEETEGVRMPTIRRDGYLKLRVKVELGTVSNLGDLESAIGSCDLKLAAMVFLTHDMRCTDSNVQSLLESDARAYIGLKIPPPKLSGEGYIIHNARCT